MKLYVQFEGDSKERIVSYFGGPQDGSVYHYTGVIFASDRRWKVFYEALPQQARHGIPAPAPAGAVDSSSDQVSDDA
ncbi:hypothetical protein LGN35_20130 [Burkholderia multivorans]|nr:hypothetical protein [Burkholderia multivorans]